MRTLPESFTDIFEKKSVAHLATVMEDGTPQVSPVWVDLKDGHILVNSLEGRLKTRNLRANPAVAVSVTDPDNPYRMICVRGKVVEFDTEGAEAHVDRLTQKYMGKDSYPWRGPDDKRVIFKIAPETFSTQG